MGKVWKKHWLLAKVAAEKEATVAAEPKVVEEAPQPVPQAHAKVVEPEPEPEVVETPEPKAKAKPKANRKPRAKSTKSK